MLSLQLGPEVSGQAIYKGLSEGPLVQYQVLGLPPGERALIVGIGERWGFLRLREDRRPELAGVYDTSHDALARLQAEIDRNWG